MLILSGIVLPKRLTKELRYFFGVFSSSHTYSHSVHTQESGSQLRAFTMTVIVEPQRGQ